MQYVRLPPFPFGRVRFVRPPVFADAPLPPGTVDDLRFYLTGAASDGGVQTDPHAALGNFRSSTETERLGVLVRGPLPGITVVRVSGANTPGNGSLELVDVNSVRWTAPDSETPGDAVSLTVGVDAVLLDGADPSKFVRVNRTSAAELAGGAVLELVDQYNNVFGLKDAAEAESSAGSHRYRAIMLRALTTVKDLQLYLGTLGTQRTSSGGGLPASGAGTITGPADAFTDWPPDGMCRVETSGGSLREIVYYTSRTDNVLTVPAAGRARLGTSAAAGTTTDIVNAVPPIRIGAELASPAINGGIQTIANESTAPSTASFVGAAWSTAITAAGGIAPADLAYRHNLGLWIDRELAAGTTGTPRVLDLVWIQFVIENVTHTERLAGLFRVADNELRRLELRAGVNADPALNATPAATQVVPIGQTPKAYLQATPWTPDYVLSTGNTHHLITDFRDEYNLRSDGIEVTKVRVDGGGAEIELPPSAPEGIRLVAAGGGNIHVYAYYLYDRDETAQQADQIALYIRTDGTNPDPSVDSPTLVSMVKRDGLAVLVGSNGEPYWVSSAYADGTTFKVIVRSRRSGDTVTSTNSEVYSATASTLAGGTATGRIFYRQVAEQKQ